MIIFVSIPDGLLAMLSTTEPVTLVEIQVPVTEPAISAVFYRQLFDRDAGPAVEVDGQVAIAFATGRLRVRLLATEVSLQTAPLRMVFRSTDLDCLRERLSRVASNCVLAINTVPGDRRTLTCTDPDGHEIIVVEKRVNRSFVDAVHLAPV